MADMSRLSYCEAYSEFLMYCAQKNNTGFGDVVRQFRFNGIEGQFKYLYDKGVRASNHEYYKKLVTGEK